MSLIEFVCQKTTSSIPRRLAEVTSLRTVMKLIIAIALVLGLSIGLMADEGMWTFNNFPRAEVAKKYGVLITDQWLDQVQKSVVRLETGCSASFVSAEGLVLTNHHCVATCLADN